MPVLSVDIICDDDAAKTMRRYLICQKEPGKGVLVRRKTAGKEMRRNLFYSA